MSSLKANLGKPPRQPFVIQLARRGQSGDSAESAEKQAIDFLGAVEKKAA